MYYDTTIRFAKLIGLLPADFSQENIFEKLTFDTHQRNVYIRFIMRILEMNNKYQESVFFKSFFYRFPYIIHIKAIVES